LQTQDKIKIIGTNRKANFQYVILDKLEAGMVLLGTEVKSLRESKVNLQDAYGKFKNDELWLVNAHISEYKFGNLNNHIPLRERKLLLNKRELKRLKSKTAEKGLTIVPTKIYFKGSKIKIEIALAQGKKLYDKRERSQRKRYQKKIKQIIVYAFYS
jgi:SsrA-binding protein